MGRPVIDLTGQRFGRLVVIEQAGRDKRGAVLWRCKCDCGNEAVVLGNLLKRGGTKSCGCISAELWAVNHLNAHTTHGGTHTRLYCVWYDMKVRCENKSSRGYKWYGALGVKVCDEWHDFGKFREWAMSSGYDPSAPRGQCTLDRIDPYGNYEPSNCRWVPMSVQCRNRRRDYDKRKRQAIEGSDVDA